MRYIRDLQPGDITIRLGRRMHLVVRRDELPSGFLSYTWLDLESAAVDTLTYNHHDTLLDTVEVVMRREDL